MTSAESCGYQLGEWLRGNPMHNCIRDECCPDFSCCATKIKSSMEERLDFVNHILERDSNEWGLIAGFLGLVDTTEFHVKLELRNKLEHENEMESPVSGT